MKYMRFRWEKRGVDYRDVYIPSGMDDREKCTQPPFSRLPRDALYYTTQALANFQTHSPQFNCVIEI